MGRAKRIWYLSHMRAAKVQASLRIRAVSPEPPLLAHTSSESRGTFRRKARSLAPLNGWACAVKVCHDGMLEDTNSLGGAHIVLNGYMSGGKGIKCCLSSEKSQAQGPQLLTWECLIQNTKNNLWATSWENLFMPYVNNKGTDQPVYPCSFFIATRLLWCWNKGCDFSSLAQLLMSYCKNPKISDPL